jgi:hypothetical protein
MAGAVIASAVVEEEATAVSAETNPDVDLSEIMGMGLRLYAPATAMPWRVAASLMARHLMVARPMVEGPTAVRNTNSRRLFNSGRRIKPETAGAFQFRRSTFCGLTSGRPTVAHCKPLRSTTSSRVGPNTTISCYPSRKAPQRGYQFADQLLAGWARFVLARFRAAASALEVRTAEANCSGEEEVIS